MTRHGLTLRHEGHHAPNDRTVFVASVLFAALVFPVVGSSQSATPKFDSSRAYADLQKMVEMGPRPAGSREHENTRA